MDRADTLFSIYIRRKYADWKGYVACYTCGKVAMWEKDGMQCGHFVSRDKKNTRYDEANARVQCLTEESNILFLDGVEKKISDIKIGDKLEAFNEKTFKKENSIVKGVRKFIPNKLYKIELDDGSYFCATGDHKVISNGEWISIEEMLHSCTEHDILEI